MLIKRFASQAVVVASLAVAPQALLTQDANAAVVVVATESGGDVTVSSTGSLNVTGLSFQTNTYTLSPGFLPSVSSVSFAAGSTVTYDEYTFVSGPANIGSGGDAPADLRSGVNWQFEFNSGFKSVVLPQGYRNLANKDLVSSFTFLGTTVANLGVNEGTYRWTLANNDYIELRVGQVPLPAALPLLATALAGIGVLGRRRSRAG